MIILLLFSFLAGIVTVLSPCILPLLPIILAGSADSGEKSRRKPIGIVTGFILSFSFFTLFLSTVVRILGINPNGLRLLSVYVIAGFGLSMLIPKFQTFLEKLFSFFSNLIPNKQTGDGFVSGLVVGLSLGLLWTPCVGPILASVISLAIIGSVNSQALWITFAYSLGTAIPMLTIMQGGRNLLQKNRWLVKHSGNIQRFFGFLMILTAIGIAFGFDRSFQTYVLNKFPRYGAGLTKFEDNALVQKSLESSNGNKQIPPTSELPKQTGPQAPELIKGGKWFNTDKELSISSLKGKVVLVDFWTYSCINCIRTLPYIKKWWSDYEKDGLVIIGVHSPEFEFEKDPTNVQNAISNFGLKYPIMQDNDFATWRAYNNRYWPAKYLIDKDGYVRYYHFGEGNYDETERMIQQLLSEMSGNTISTPVYNPVQTGSLIRTPETYLGYARLESLASKEFPTVNKKIVYTVPETIPNDKFALEGEWLVTPQYIEGTNGAKLLLNYQANNVYLVMGKQTASAKVKIYVDDKLQFYGADNKEGIVTLDNVRLYELVNNNSGGRHILKIEIIEGSVQAFAFTFG